MNRRLLIYAGVVACLVILWGYLVLIPHSRKVRTTDALAQDTQRQLSEAQQFTLQLPAFIKTQERLRAEWIDLNSRLYAAADIMALLRELRSEAARRGLKVIEITPPIEELLRLNEAMTKSSSPQYLNIEILLAGDFVPLGEFVQQVEREDYTRGINRCIITGSRDGSEPLQLQLGFRALLGSGGDV